MLGGYRQIGVRIRAAHPLVASALSSLLRWLLLEETPAPAFANGMQQQQQQQPMLLKQQQLMQQQHGVPNYPSASPMAVASSPYAQQRLMQPQQQQQQEQPSLQQQPHMLLQQQRSQPMLQMPQGMPLRGQFGTGSVNGGSVGSPFGPTGVPPAAYL